MSAIGPAINHFAGALRPSLDHINCSCCEAGQHFAVAGVDGSHKNNNENTTPIPPSTDQFTRSPGILPGMSGG
jgi:hypothetical protein